MTSLGFENYAEALKIYLSKYREVRMPLLLLTVHGLTYGQHEDEISNQRLQQSQSNRGENQNRPGSQGYGAAGGSNPGSGAFPGADLQGEGADPAAYALYGAQAPHNGAPGEY